MMKHNIANLLISCSDRPGIIASVSNFLKEHQANIIDSDQHTSDPNGGRFFMRLEFQIADLKSRQKKLEQAFQTQVAIPFKMEWSIHYADTPKKIAIFVSKFDHALFEILWRWSRRELAMTIPFIISNHPDLENAAKNFNIPFHYIPVTAETKLTAEAKMLALCEEAQLDGIVLARYMQILTENFIQHYPNKIINIHHSFLPAFVGANPYKQAYARGVKLIGATAHFVTPELDMGPIISQDIVRVSHRLDVEKLRELGQNVERMVLAQAVTAFTEDRIIVDGNKTIVFNVH